MLHLHSPAVSEPFRLEQDVNPFQERGIPFEFAVRPTHNALTSAADGHDVQAQPLRLGKGARAEGQRPFRVRFADHARATAGGSRELGYFDSQPPEDRHGGLVELRGCALRSATRVQGVSNACHADSFSCCNAAPVSLYPGLPAKEIQQEGKIGSRLRVQTRV